MERNKVIDFLRFFAVTLIILAHSGPPDIMFQIRTFDVPLMVFLSGCSYYIANKDKKISFDSVSLLNFFKKRFMRLVLPVWFFLIFYFLFTLEKDITLMFKSFTLISGIGYVWFIRVIFIFSLISPFILFYYRKVNNKFFFVLFFSCFCLLVNNFFINIYNFHNNAVFRVLFFDWFGYLPLFLCGLAIFELKSYQKSVIIILSIFYTISNFNPDLQLYKYPPHSIYITYGLTCSLLLWILLEKEKIRNFLNVPLVERAFSFVSSNSIWIYLVHIVFVTLFMRLGTPWYISFVCIYMFSIVIIIVKNNVLYHFELSRKLKNILKG